MLPLKKNSIGTSIASKALLSRPRANQYIPARAHNKATSVGQIRLACRLIPIWTSAALSMSGKKGYESFVPGKIGFSLAAPRPLSAKFEIIERCHAKSPHVLPPEYKPSGLGSSMCDLRRQKKSMLKPIVKQAGGMASRMIRDTRVLVDAADARSTGSKICDKNLNSRLGPIDEQPSSSLLRARCL
jgi:hypothetical protein